MQKVDIREMSRKDLQAVAKMESESQSHPWSLVQFLDCFKAGNTGWLAFREYRGVDVAVGFAITSTVLDESSLLNLCVRPPWQNQGVGRALLEFVLDRARAERINRYFLEVRQSNQVAIHLYESLGFERMAVRRDYYPAYIGREDGLVYSLSLSLASASAAPGN